MSKLSFIVMATVFSGLQSQICAIQAYNINDTYYDIRKRTLHEAGYTDVQLANVTLSNNNTEIQHRHARELRDTRVQFYGKTTELQIATDDVIYEFLLRHAKTVVNDDTLVRVFDGYKETMTIIPPLDCFLYGSLKEYPDHTAIISYCNGLRGTFTDGHYNYHIEAMDTDGKSVEGTVFVARIKKPSINDTYENFNKSISNPKERHKRAVRGSLEIETVVILDEEYVAKMRASGHFTNQSLVDLMALKWAGVQAEWGRADVLQYEVTISIVEIVIWETNPSWYTPSTVLDNTLLSICRGASTRGLWANADHIHLFTGRSGTDVAGRAYTGDICVDGRKCAVSTNTHEDEYVITAHELGHSMGMAHDSDVGCPAPNDGIMGSKTASWSTCSVAAMNLEVTQPESSCLTRDDVPSASVINLPEAWPGMIYTDDEICELKYGAGFRIKSSRTSCSGDLCMILNTNSPNYGVSHFFSVPTDGSYCGEQMVCSSQQVGGIYKCINWNDTRLNLTLFTTVTGGWSAWGSMTSCSRTCGTGIQYRQRTCNNPMPRNSAWCEGNEFDASLCNIQPCYGDSSEQSTLVNQRAGETCTHWKTNNLYAMIGKVSANYLYTGTTYGSSGDDQCEVKCNTIAGYTANGERHGIMPDGTPCTHSSLLSYEEVNNLPRKSGMFGACVQGYCYLFGCDSRSGTMSKDGCGVCGGDNSSCQIISGMYDTILPQRTRGVVAILPTNATLLQFQFAFATMIYNFLEVRTKEDIAVTDYQVLSTMDNPVNFAGTYWYYQRNKQLLYAEGPINQPLVVKLFNYANYNNTGVSYIYSIPPAKIMAACNDTCENGGIYNTTICSCNCPKGYYGNTCSTQCSKICKNSQSATSTAANCQCNCLGNTYGNTCNCKYPFTGIDCQDCKKTTCLNGGTFNATACRCSCPQGYGDLDCSTPCEDKGAATVNCTNKASLGHCTSQNEVMEEKCYLTCGLCIAVPSPTTATAGTTVTTPTATSDTTALAGTTATIPTASSDATAPAGKTATTPTASSNSTTASHATESFTNCPDNIVECGGAVTSFVQLTAYLGILLLHLAS